MHVQTILHQLLSTAIHQTRLKTLLALLTGLIDSKQLKLTQLGRSLPANGKERAGILRVDRFLRNEFYQKNTIVIYRCISRFVIGNSLAPDIIVDWSSIPNSNYTAEGGEHCVLRASFAAEGRSITLYEEVHAKKDESHPKVHKAFLENLKSVLPENCCPCIITDAGFKTPWFKEVIGLGWNYIGRVRGLIQYDDGNGFQTIKNLFAQASNVPRYLGNYLLAKTGCLTTHFYLYKEEPKGRHKWTKTKNISKDKASKKYGDGHNEPWVLVSSLLEKGGEQKIIKKFKTRMSIEESFRDTKSVEFGFSMRENRTIKSERYIVWLMLAALGSLIAWVVGYAGEQQKLHYDFQANTYRHRRVLSFFYLGCQIIRKRMNIPIDLKLTQLQAWGP